MVNIHREWETIGCQYIYMCNYLYTRANVYDEEHTLMKKAFSHRLLFMGTIIYWDIVQNAISSAQGSHFDFHVKYICMQNTPRDLRFFPYIFVLYSFVYEEQQNSKKK